MRVIESISNGATFHDLCVICSILVLTHFSPTSPMPLLTIQRILATVPTTLSVVEMAGERRGTLGAGGSVGRLSSIDGMNDGSSGSFGGAGSCGIEGIAHLPPRPNLPFCELNVAVRSTLICGGSGSVGSAGSGIDCGVK